MIPSKDAPKPQLHILSVLVENRAGVLSRVASLFARRGFNIHSLAVAPTDDDRFSGGWLAAASDDELAEVLARAAALVATRAGAGGTSRRR